MRRANIGTALFAALLLLCALWPLVVPWLHPRAAAVAEKNQAAPEWAEAQWLPHNGTRIQLPLSALEQRFARQFPGHIGRFTDGRQEWIVRVMDQPTRMLHPASDCFRGMGYEVATAHVRLDQRGQHWRCFKATRHGKTLKVCERIFNAHGAQWTEASSWYWSALLNTQANSGGPWWAVTQVEQVQE
ncbi:MAG: hypothetical protein V4805_03600 [Pseudomonadota bacterium]